MELIENYLYAVGKKLPLKQRKDILDELRSIIMDNLDDITGGGEPTEADTTKVLLEMGAPSEVAKRYRTGPSWLIGPKYYDSYILVLKIVLAATAGGYLLSLIISAFTQSGSFWEIIWQLFYRLFAIIPGLLSAAGAVTLIFAIIERAVKKPIDIDFGEGAKWSPEKLEPMPEKEDIVKPLESILGIVFTVLAIVIFNLYRNKLGLYYMTSADGEWMMINIFNPKALDLYIPIWSALWALSIGLNGWLLGTGKHNVGTRVFEMFISAANVVVLFFIAKGPVLFQMGEADSPFEVFRNVIDFLSRNHSTIFNVLAALTLLSLLTLVGKFIYRRAKSMQN